MEQSKLRPADVESLHAEIKRLQLIVSSLLLLVSKLEKENHRLKTEKMKVFSNN
jgi:hypothetical protein